MEAPKKFKNQSGPLFRPSSVNFFHNFLNLSYETFPLDIWRIFLCEHIQGLRYIHNDGLQT
jgi:hypothetical protein